VLGRERDRLAEAEAPGLGDAGGAGLSLGLVGGEDHLARAPAQDVGEDLVRRRHARTRVDQEEAGVGLRHRALGQPTHAARQALVGGILQPGGVEHREAERADPPLALAQVAGDAGLIVDEREAPADEAVEQGGLAHVGAPHDGEAETHRPQAPSAQAAGLAHSRLSGKRAIARRA
jgi:hypothetical protein